MEMLGHGVYSIPEAARLTHLKPSRVREWFRGKPKGATRRPVFRSDYPPVARHLAISFHDLIELYVAGRLREHGVSLQTLRKMHRQLRSELDVRHPFCRKELLTDGKTVFTRGLDDVGRDEMVDVLGRQRVFAEILMPFLKRISYDEATLLARKWQVADLVVIDPAICLGKPIIEPVGIATSILAAAYHANDQNAELVADWYQIHPRHVLAAVAFERNLAA